MNISALILLTFGIPFGVPLTFEWQAPTQNTDGSPLEDLRQYRLYEKVRSGPWQLRMGISPNVTRVKYRPHTDGVHRFRMTAVNMKKIESSPSNEIEVILERPVPKPSVSPTP